MGELTQQDIDDILRLVDASDFDEFKLELGDLKLEVRRRGASSRPGEPTSGPDVIATSPKSESSAPATDTVATAAAVDTSCGKDVPSPLLGTFYHAPKPGADPFVKVGDQVASDTVIGIIEVMKLMNSVTANITGTVTEIVASNGQLVEHGQTLIRVRPA